MAYSKHETALVESESIGDGTRIGAFVHILPGARIGADCTIRDQTLIESDVVLGDRVTVNPGVRLWDGIVIEDDVLVGANATFASDDFPHGKQYPGRAAKTVIRRGASIGANATILPGLTIGERAMIGAGAVLTRDAPPNALLLGNPARIVGYAGVSSPVVTPITIDHLAEPGVTETSLEGVTIHRLPLVEDLRGTLSFAEVHRHLPFEIKRYFVVFGVESEEVRGEHAHRTLHQFLVCVHGKCHIVVDDGTRRQEIMLDRPTLGLHVKPMVWAVQYKYSSDAALLVFASDYYDPGDYIRDYSDYLAAVRGRPAGTSH